MNMEQIQAAADYLIAKFPSVPKIAVVLGSGLGAFAEELTDVVEVPFAEIPDFPISTVTGHKGCFVYGKLGEKEILVMRGRVHFYEGYTMQQIAMPVAVMKMMGVGCMIMTNAAGAINEEYEPGDLVVITDHIKLSLDSPLRGDVLPELGERFPALTEVYDRELAELAKEISYGVDIPMHEGVYAFMGGPQYETAAEIRMLGVLGADVVGMSTVPEVIMAAKCGMRVLALSFVTNYAAGVSEDGQPLSHEGVVQAGGLIKDKLAWLLKGIIERIKTV